MQECKLVKFPIIVGVKLSIEHYPKTHKEIKYLTHVPYGSDVGSILYAMACT